MDITKENLEQLRKDRSMRLLVEDVFGLDLNEIIDNVELELEHQKMVEKRSKEIVNEMKAKESEKEESTKTFTNIHNKEKYETPKVEKTFLMNYEQFRKFIEDYSELLNALKKIEYFYGLSFKDSSTGFSFVGKVNEIIWDLIGIIFGEDNREDIADYLYGNSNFDSPKDLYEELI